MSTPGSNAALVDVVDRILRLTQNNEVAVALTTIDRDNLQHRAKEALETLSLCGDGTAEVEAATPSLCGLAVECVNVVERAELSTGLARLVTAGCEVLAALIHPRLLGDDSPGFSPIDKFTWVHETLEDLSDELDFLALEVYCGLGRLEGMVTESDELPIVPDPIFDHFESYWGSIEHKQALQELSAWLLCVVFRALGRDAVTARSLMEFANHDLLCLCALLRGLLASEAGGGASGGLPDDAVDIQGVALGALCGLTAPELAFPHHGEEEGVSILDQNRVLTLYLEVLCAAFVETGLLEAVTGTTLERIRRSRAPSDAALGARVLGLLARLVMQAESVTPSAEDPSPPGIRIRDEVVRRADRLGSLLEAVLVTPPSGAVLRDLVASCAGLTAPLAARRQRDCSDDGLTLACRVLLATCLDSTVVDEDADGAAMLAALVALAANVDDLDISRVQLAERIGRLRPEDRARGRARLCRDDSMRLPVHGRLDDAAALFGDATPGQSEEAEEGGAGSRPVVGDFRTLPAAPLEKLHRSFSKESAGVKAAPPPAAAPPAADPAGRGGLRDLVQHAPEEFRCALDRKLLCDPVVSPGGVVFERTTLARWLQTHGPACPVTGAPLRLEDCRRSPEIRKKAAAWVRGAGRPRREGRRKKNG